MDDWSDLGVFHAVAEEGSLAKAARRLKLSHPTIGRRLDALEQRLGGQLVHRGAAGIELTALGHAIHDNVRRMGLEAEAIHRLAAGDELGLAGIVTITALDGMGTIVARVLSELLENHPDLDFNLDISSRQANLARREADIALRIGRPGDQASLIARRIARIGMGLYASPAYLDARGRPKTAEDLSSHDAVTTSLGGELLWARSVDGEPTEPARVIFDSNSPTAMFAAAEAGMGVSPQSHWRARATLERVLPQADLMTLDLWAVTHADIKRNARIRLVFDHLADRFAANARYFLEGDPEIPERFE